MSDIEPQASEPTPTEPQQQTPEAAAPETPDAPQPVEETTSVTPVAAGEAEAPAGETPEPSPVTAPPPPPPKGTHWGTGRRKSSIARVRIVPGTGKVLINKRDLDKYFTELKDRTAVTAPLDATGKNGLWDVLVNVHGGGPSGQSGAILLGVARALVTADSTCEPTLRDSGFLTRDARRVERKKYGRRKARRSFQFSKR